MSATGYREDLAELMGRNISLLRTLEAELMSENEALCRRDPQLLTECIERKMRLLRELEATSQGLASLLQGLGFTSDKKGLEACLDTPKLRKLWENLCSGLRNVVTGTASTVALLRSAVPLLIV